jgi:hypothetical protein
MEIISVDQVTFSVGEEIYSPIDNGFTDILTKLDVAKTKALVTIVLDRSWFKLGSELTVESVLVQTKGSFEADELPPGYATNSNLRRLQAYNESLTDEGDFFFSNIPIPFDIEPTKFVTMISLGIFAYIFVIAFVACWPVHFCRRLGSGRDRKRRRMVENMESRLYVDLKDHFMPSLDDYDDGNTEDDSTFSTESTDDFENHVQAQGNSNAPANYC